MSGNNKASKDALEAAAKKAILGDSDNIPVSHSDVITNLGTVTTTEEKLAKETEIYRKEGSEIGYRDVKVTILPTTGIFYPKDTQIQARPLQLKEIKHYSTMDEDEIIDVYDKTGQILDSCLRIYMSGRKVSYKNLVETDRMFFIFYLRDMTMQAHGRDVKLYHTSISPFTGEKVKVEINNEIFEYNEIPKSLFKFFSHNDRQFIITDPDIPEGFVKFQIPTVGVIRALGEKVYRWEMAKRMGEEVYYNKPFYTKYAQWIIEDWSMIEDEKKMRNLENEYGTWSAEKMDIMNHIDKHINYSIRPEVSMVDKEGNRWKSVVSFRKGISSIFNISDISSRLFED